MDFLTGEIAKLKRKAPTSEDKYIKRSEIEAQRRAEYRQEQERILIQRRDRDLEKLQHLKEHESAKRRKIERQPEKIELDAQAIRQGLIELKEPVRLFGETEKDVEKRLALIKGRNERHSELTGGITDRLYSEPPDSSLPDRQAIKIDPEWLTGDEESTNRLQENLSLTLRIYIKQWHDDAKNEAASGDGQSLNLFMRAKEHLARLLSRLKARNLPRDILRNLCKICLALNLKDFTSANHAYLQMSIGKATWPVGITMVGIHERAQKERKRQEMDGAHILTDDTTRQWLQSLKRLITHLEKKNA